MRKIIQVTLFLALTFSSFSCNDTDEVSDKFEQLSFTKPVIECSAAENTLETTLNFDRWDVISYKVIEQGDTVQVENPIKNDGLINYYDNNIKGDWFTINKDGKKIIIHLTENQTGQKRALNVYCEGIMLFGAELKVEQN